ncbi:MAG: HAMP domain-containing histidine kinase [Lachnospiraceae bacterium]|nr:HAMP domain-containing histidine kinase [Lachnospiraceae bacterium]
MKKYRNVLIASGAVYLLGVLLFALFTMPGKEDPDREALVLKLNEIVHIVEEKRNDPGSLGGTEYGVDYAVTDTLGEVQFSTVPVENGRISVETAIKKGYPYRYFFADGRLLGCVILLDDGSAQFAKLRIRMLLGMCVFGAALITAAGLFGMYVTKRIYRPFRELKDFAGRVAEGKLDEPLSMDRSNMFGAFSESFDIMREELRTARIREADLQKREKELVASLSHDLKTPITGIKLTSELLSAKLAHTPGMEDYTEKIANIYKKADQIDVLVSDLFSATLEELGEFKVNCTDESSQILTEILKKYDDKGLVQAQDVPEVLIHIDPRRMHQVIGNIISNSYKYAGTGIEVSYRLVEEYLEMSVRDFGPGVPEEELGMILGKFYRGKKWAESKEEGSGLGLYIASTLMEKMDGELLPSNEGRGFKITLMIPLS